MSIPLIQRASLFPLRTAIVAEEGAATYATLLNSSAFAARRLMDDSGDLRKARVAFLVNPGFDYVAVEWAIWRAGGVAVPLCPQHPAPELTFVLEDAKVSLVVGQAEFETMLRPMAIKNGCRYFSADSLLDRPEQDIREDPLCPVKPCNDLPDFKPSRRALMLYTSGTTGKPKGVVTTHQNIRAQIESLVEAWQWRQDDHILNVLPLHHIHGIINILGCALWSGATWETLPKFDADTVWRRIGDGDLTLFMAVPTVYARLITAFADMPKDLQDRARSGCRRMRLMVSGSAALPTATLEQWREISGHTLLERYGMTEIGMALGNPYDGERVPGSVGSPMPGVEVRCATESQEIVPDGTPGEIQVRGDLVFQEYWGRPEATTAAFTADGWFKTGDIAVRQDNRYRILGRESVDIIKSGGYKISALEIEETLRTHPSITECAVVGLPDEEWGQRVAAAIVLHPGHSMDLETLRKWGKERLAIYKVPSLMRSVAELPRNAMGKITKPQVACLFEAPGTSGKASS